MQILSSVFKHGENIPAKYTCDGENINPPLSFGEVPEGAKSLVLIVDDPDAPMGTWVHWTVFDISPDIKSITENTTPKGAREGITSFGGTGYGGPCPHSGTHHYYFKLYATDIAHFPKFEVPATAADLMQLMKGHILSKAELIGLYNRGK
jgi:Raf kinase inhibitor-like YbhB/YbcL family protein